VSGPCGVKHSGERNTKKKDKKKGWKRFRVNFKVWKKTGGGKGKGDLGEKTKILETKGVRHLKWGL